MDLVFPFQLRKFGLNAAASNNVWAANREQALPTWVGHNK